MRKRVAGLLVAVLVIGMMMVVAGCQRAQKSDKITIGFVRSESNDTWLSYLHDAFAGYFDGKSEYEILWGDGQNDVTRQLDNLNALIAQGVKALVVVPVDTSAAAPMTRAAQEAGIPIVYVNRNPFVGGTPPQNVYYVGSDSVIAGRLQMEELGRLMGGTGEIAIMMGQLNHEAAQDRTRGVKEVVAQQFPNIRIRAEQTGNWMRNEGVTVMENWLTAFPDLKAIASNNDEMALGALAAINSSGRTGILLGGTDGNPDALQAVKDGSLALTVLQDAQGQGRGAAEYVTRAINGEKLESIRWVPFVLITKDNVESFM